MNPESVTTGQLISHFTAKHWTAVVIATFSILSSIGGGGYWFATQRMESQSLVLQAELRGTLAQSQAKLEIAQSRSEQSAALLSQLQSAYQKLQADLAERQQTIESLNIQLGRANDCAFIQEQIIATQKLIDYPSGLLLFDSNKDRDGNEKERIALLQQRLDGYQDKLSTCRK